MTEIISTIITAATSAATGLASALVDAFDALAYGTDGALSTVFSTMLVFVGFSVAISLFSKVFSLIKSKLRKNA